MNKAKPLARAAAILLLLALISSSAAAQSLELQNISVYNVTAATGEDRYTGGEFLASGTNTTFLVNQTRDREDYRFTFRVSNSGADWTIQGEDILFHENLSTSWSINRTWYNASGTEYEGGSFSNGRISWDTSQGGTLNSGDSLYAKYIVEVDQQQSARFDQRFLANDTSENNWTQDEHVLDLNRLGHLNLILEEPPNETVLTQNKTFVVNSTIECIGGECSDVTATPRYNTSSTPDTVMPEMDGEPFHTLNANTGSCTLLAGENCFVSWEVNATAADSTSHLIDVNASSSYSEIEEEDSADAEVDVRQVVMMNLSWDATDFGLLDPGDRQKPAIGNDNLTYNVSILENSNEADIWIKGEDLISQEDSNYRIGIENMNYSLENLQSSSEPVQQSYSLLKGGIGAGNVLNTFYWLDVPTGIIKGDYKGSITFKANISQ